ncbi:hypothetical protein [Phenylobacterium sp.]|uniref:hypothetical protein n=1 Tax=Phenylobacterium sp. TaxID=1871053 RepID=UPI002DEFF7C2|nr:hypothetical protein [Phenylobacterium sp.]
MAILLTTMGLTACGRRDSLYIEPGREAAPEAPAKHQAARPGPVKPAPAKP